MKKTITVITCVLIFFVVYFLQSNFFNWFTIAGVQPSIYIIFVLYIGLFMGRRVGLPLGVFFGMLLDIFSGRVIGIYAIMLGLVGLIGGYIDKKFSKESKITIILCVFFLTIFYELGVYLFNKLVFGSILEFSFFARTVLIEAFFNSILLIIIYPIIKRVGYFVENIFRGKNILTRYF